MGIAAAFILLNIQPTKAGDDSPCDERAMTRAREAALEHAYQRRRPAPYCDGLTPVFNKGELHLVSLTLGDIRYAATQAILIVARIRDAQAGVVKIRGQDKRPGGSYRLDGVVPPSGLHIDLSGALHPARIEPSNLGLVAWREVAGRVVYQPVRAGTENAADKVVVVLTSSKKVIAAAGQICTAPNNGCEPKLKISDIMPHGTNLGSLVRFEVPRERHAREVWFKVSTLSPGNERGAFVVSMWIPGQDE